ncbi:MAG: hypothetical protein KDD63_01405 [Bacteroidetes bacterium]|nr:hypothetical protein [Bacteroidota bacterium]
MMPDINLITAILESEMGSDIVVDPVNKNGELSPMSLILREAISQSGKDIPVYWIDGGFPEIFCLQGHSNATIFSTRYLSFTALLRQLFVNNYYSDDIRIEMAEKISFHIVAELALRKGNADFAAFSMVKNLVGKGLFFPWTQDEKADLITLERENINEAYMGTWFYGLLHELGHFPDETVDEDLKRAFSNEYLFSWLERLLPHFPYSQELKEKVFSDFKAQGNKGLLDPDEIREEIAADIFAISVLLKSTVQIMDIVKQSSFSILKFFQEILVSISIVFIFNSCKRMALHGSKIADLTYEEAFSNVVQPVLFSLRSNLIIQYLKHAVITYLGGQISGEVDSAISELIREMTKFNNLLEKGWNKAMRFSVFPEERGDQFVLLKELKKELSGPNGAMLRIELDHFCKKAQTLNRKGNYLDELIKLNDQL